MEEFVWRGGEVLRGEVGVEGLDPWVLIVIVQYSFNSASFCAKQLYEF